MIQTFFDGDEFLMGKSYVLWETRFLAHMELGDLSESSPGGPGDG